MPFLAIPAVMYSIMAVSAAAAVAGGVMQYQASRDAAKTASNVANYNSALDVEQSRQNDIDAQANITRQRQQNKIYLSRQRSAIAAAGVLEAGSPLDLMATTAGQMETDIQDQWRQTNMSDQNLYSQAKAGVAYGDAQASGLRAQGTASLFSTVAQVGGMAAQDYSMAGATKIK